MAKIKNKFIIFVILIIIWIISYGIFIKIFNDNIDRWSYVVLLNWQAKLNQNFISLNNKELIIVWDTVRTIWNSSLAVLEWWDGSVTRLWWDTLVEIKELDISDNLSNINIWFELFNWKTWSTVISFLWEGSYFKEYFRDSEAAVRGTIFNIDLNNDYLSVIDHNIKLITSSWELISIDENRPLDISSFKFISLEKFIQSFKDKDWEKLNLTFDLQLFNWLKNQIHNNLDELLKFKDFNIKDSLSHNENRAEIYNKLLEDYQKLNFIKPTDWELFITKLQLKDALIKVADDDNKEWLINSILFDFKDIISTKDYNSLETLLPMLVENKDIIWDINFEDYFNNWILPNEVKSKIANYFGNLKNFFWEKFNDVENIDIIDEVKNVNDKANEFIQEGLDDLFINE